MSWRSAPKIAAVILFVAVGIGCRDSYFDKAPVYSAHEFLTREDRAEELVYAMQQAGLTGVALIAGAPETPIQPPYPDPGPPPDANELVMKGFEQSKGKLIPFVTLAPGSEHPDQDFKALHERGARGLALWPTHRNPASLIDPTLEPLYRYVELYGVPVFTTVETEQQVQELSSVLYDHPQMKVIVSGFMDRADDLPTIERMMELHPNVYVDIGLDGEPGFEQKLAKIAAEPDAGSFFTLMQDRVLFAGGLLFDHRLTRNGTWGMQTLKAYRGFLERPVNRMRLLDENDVWAPAGFNGLALDHELLEKIYYSNFLRVIGQSFKERPPIEFNSLTVSAPPGWRFDPISRTRLVPALVASPLKLVQRVSTQRLRDIFAGKLKDWSELNGEPGPITLASYGPLVRIAAAQLDAPLVAPLREYDSEDEVRAAMEADPNVLGLITMSGLDGWLVPITVNGDNPVQSNLMYCASKSSPTVSAYFPNYPLLIPVTLPADAQPQPFEPYELRTVLIAGTVKTPAGFDPNAVKTTRIVTREGTEAEDLIAQRVRPVYSIGPQIRRSDFSVFVAGDTPNEFLLRALGARAVVGRDGIEELDPIKLHASKAMVLPVRGVPIGLSTTEANAPAGGLNLVFRPEGASPDPAADADVVVVGQRVTYIKGIGSVEIALGDFLADDGSTGAYLTLSYYGNRLVAVQLTPTSTADQMVQRRYGPEARSETLKAIPGRPATASEPGGTTAP